MFLVFILFFRSYSMDQTESSVMEGRKTMKGFEAIQNFFDGDQPVTLQELKALDPQSRKELARLSAAALGVELKS